MLGPYRKFLSKNRILLASGSPRRKEILEQLGLEFTCQSSDYDERELDPKDFGSKEDYVIQLARMKIKSLKLDGDLPHLIIGADTIVVSDGEILGKPETEEKASETLRKLSGKTHQVFTGVALDWSNSYLRGPTVTTNPQTTESTVFDSFSVLTLVKMGELSEKDIDAYVRTGEPLDKAGAYGIQGLGGSLVDSIQGDYYNVVGFPMHAFCKVVRSRMNSAHFQTLLEAYNENA